MDKIQIQIQKDKDKGVYASKIKDNCQFCNARLKHSEERYVVNGNLCQFCNTLAKKCSEGIKEARNINGKWREAKIRDYTEKEKIEMIRKRKIEVVENNL